MDYHRSGSAASGSAVAAPLEDDSIRTEYVRSMNKKDLEVQRLITENKRLELELKKEHEKHRAEVLDLRGEIDRLNTVNRKGDSVHQSDRTAMAELRVERDALRSDIQILKDTIQTQEDQLKSLYKTAQKMEKAEVNARSAMESETKHITQDLEDRLSKAHVRIDSLVTQRQEHDQENVHLRREGERWKTECENNRKQVVELEGLLRESRHQQKEMLPNSTVAQEVRQLEGRHNAIVTGLEREVNRLRDEARERALQVGRQDALIEDYRKKTENLEVTLQAVTRKAQESASDSALKQLQQQHLEAELKSENLRTLDNLRDQLDRVTKDRGQFEGELIIAQRRIQELEAAASLASRRFTEDQTAAQKETFDIRQKLSLETAEAAEAKRRNDLLQEETERLQAKLDSLRDVSSDQIASLKSDVEQAANLIASTQSKNKHLEALTNDLRDQLDKRGKEMVSERSGAMQTEHSLRSAHAEALGAVRAKDEERQQLLKRHDDELEAREEQRVAELARLNREHKDETIRLQSTIRQYTDRNSEMQSALEQQSLTIESLENRLKAKTEKEQALQQSYRDLDKETTMLKYEAAEKDGSVVTLQRALESSDATLKSARHELESCRNSLENERRKAVRLEEQVTSSDEQNAAKEKDNRELADSVQRYKNLNKEIQQDSDAQISSLRQKVQNALNDHASSEQNVLQLKTELSRERESHKVEVSRVEQRHAEECNQLQREVLMPLQEKVEALVNMNNRLHNDVQERDFKLRQMTELQITCDRLTSKAEEADVQIQQKDLKLRQIDDDLRQERETNLNLQRVQREKVTVDDEVRRLRGDNESLMRKITSLEAGLGNATKDVTEVRSRELDLNGQLQQRRSENSTLREQVANLESMKQINEKQIKDEQRAFRELQQRFDDLKHTHSTLQSCFNKQQEQLDNADALRRDVKRF